MGLVKTKEGFKYKSDKGIIYDLFEGLTIGGDKQYTSDIIFIIPDDSMFFDDDNLWDYYKIVDWFRGATDIENEYIIEVTK